MDAERVRRQATWMAAIWAGCGAADVAVIVTRPHPWIGLLGLPFSLWFLIGCVVRFRKPPAPPDPTVRERVTAALANLCSDRNIPLPTLLMVPRGACHSVKWTHIRSTLPVSEAQVRQLDDHPLDAYLVHSLAHLSDPKAGESRWILWAVILCGGLSAGILAASYPLEVVGLYPAGLLVALRAVQVPSARLAREAELRADHHAVAALQTDGPVLIAAWQSLYQWVDTVNSRRWPPYRILMRAMVSPGGPPLDRRIAVINDATRGGPDPSPRSRGVAGLRRRR